MRCILLVLSVTLLFGCLSPNTHNKLNQPQSSDELLDFAKASCFFWYFKKKGYNLDDIGSISGGIVEKGSYSADRYQQVSLLVKNYSPLIQTKQNIDSDLLKCFTLEDDPDFIRSINKLN